MTTASKSEGGKPAGLDSEDVAAALAAPFDASEVKFKPAATAGNRALALPYVDARVVQDRLDDVLGVLNWQDSYEVLPDGAVVCRLKVRLGDEWITKEDVGGPSEQPDEGDKRKAAFSDALKRAAVKFGIGRYLYRQKPQWVDYDPNKRQFVRQPSLPLPLAGVRGQESAKAPKGWFHELRAYDDRCGYAGELVKCVAAGGKHNGYSDDLSEWTQKQIDWAREEARAFEARREKKGG